MTFILLVLTNLLSVNNDKIQTRTKTKLIIWTLKYLTKINVYN